MTEATERALAAMSTTLAKVIGLLVKELLKAHGGAGPWFENLKAKTVVEIKNTSPDNLNGRQETSLIEAGVHFVTGIFDKVRDDFEKNSTR
jgi:hypothetical protein